MKGRGRPKKPTSSDEASIHGDSGDEHDHGNSEASEHPSDEASKSEGKNSQSGEQGDEEQPVKKGSKLATKPKADYVTDPLDYECE